MHLILAKSARGDGYSGTSPLLRELLTPTTYARIATICQGNYRVLGYVGTRRFRHRLGTAPELPPCLVSRGNARTNVFKLACSCAKRTSRCSRPAVVSARRTSKRRISASAPWNLSAVSWSFDAVASDVSTRQVHGVTIPADSGHFRQPQLRSRLSSPAKCTRLVVLNDWALC